MTRTRSSLAKWLTAFLFFAILIAAWNWLEAHPQHNPFAPLRLSDPAGWATQRKLALLNADSDACFAALDSGGVRYRRLPAIGKGMCRAEQRTAIARWPQAPAAIEPAGAAPSCAMGVGLLLWQRDIVQPMARLHLGHTIRSIEHLGSYSCRNIKGRNTPSQHASGNAIDIAAFVTSDGRRVTLAGHWNARDGRSAFLRAVRDGSCGYFSTVLSPDYNAAHADHFHLDQAARAGGWSICR